MGGAPAPERHFGLSLPLGLPFFVAVLEKKSKTNLPHLRRGDQAVSREVRRPAICPRGKGLLAEQGKALERARDDVAARIFFFFKRREGKRERRFFERESERDMVSQVSARKRPCFLLPVEQSCRSRSRWCGAGGGCDRTWREPPSARARRCPRYSFRARRDASG